MTNPKADNYARWRMRLQYPTRASRKDMSKSDAALIANTDMPAPEDCGFYRSPRKEKQPNGQWKTLGYDPVALFMDGENIVCLINGREASQNEIGNSWLYFVAHPVTEEAYRAAMDGGPWPDEHIEKKETAAEKADRIKEQGGKTIADMREENPNFDRDLERTTAMIEAQERNKPEVVLKSDIDAKRAGISQYKGIDSDEMAARCRSLQTDLLALKGRATAEYEKLNRPLLDQQKAIREVWFPLRDEADNGATECRKELQAWEDHKREVARRAQAEADRIARENAAQIRKAETENAPPPKLEEAPKVNTPPPAAQIKGATGRAASVSVQVFVTAIDEEKVFQQFKGNPELVTLLTALAQKAIRAGIQVPGATTEERSVVR